MIDIQALEIAQGIETAKNNMLVLHHVASNHKKQARTVNSEINKVAVKPLGTPCYCCDTVAILKKQCAISVQS